MVIGYVMIIMALMLLPLNNPDSGMNHIFILKLRGDYWLHILMFLPWAILNRFFEMSHSQFIWLVLGVVFAFVAEGIQYFLPYRTFNINDALSNIFGVTSGAVLNLFSKKALTK